MTSSRRSPPLALAALLLLGACSSDDGGDWASLYGMAQNAIPEETDKVSPEEAAAVPYASLGVRVGRGQQVMLLLAGGEAGERLWTSGLNIALTTRDGRIQRTAGFGHDLGGLQAFGPPGEENGATVTRWLADFPDLKLYSIPITCSQRQTGEETIVILGKDIHTLHRTEDCASTSPLLNWTFENSYWSDPRSGLVWRAIQHVHPQLDAIETETLRPPL
jgi:hypothetical protein